MDDTKRRAIATELADLKALQELLIATEQKLLPSASSDQEIADRFSDFLRVPTEIAPQKAVPDRSMNLIFRTGAACKPKLLRFCAAQSESDSNQ